MRNKIQRQQFSKEVFIVVHQVETSLKFDWGIQLQEKTAKTLSLPKFQKIPRFILASKESPVKRPSLLSQSSLVKLSYIGRFSEKLNTDVIHIAGGEFRRCLGNAVHDAVESALSFDRKTVTLNFHSNLIYDWGEGDRRGFFTLRDILLNHPHHSVHKNILKVLHKLIEKRGLMRPEKPEDEEFVFLKMDKNSTYIFQRKFDQKKVEIDIL